MGNAGRKVEISKAVWKQSECAAPGAWVIEPDGEGIFHCWGVDGEEVEGGAVLNTVAIVERKDGQIVTPYAAHVRFLTP